MLRFIVAISMIFIITRIAEDSPQIATGIMCALYIAFVIYSCTFADRLINIANRKMLIAPNTRRLYYKMIVPVDDEKEQEDDSY